MSGWPASEDPLIAPVVSAWELGDELILTSGRWTRRLRIVGVTDTGPYTREYRLREIDHGNHVLQPEADEEVLDQGRLVGSYTVELGRQQGHEDAEVDDEDRQQVGEDHGSRWRPPRRQQVDGPDFARPSGQGRREEADGEGFDGSERARRVRNEQAGLEPRGAGALAEGPVLAPGWEDHLADGAWG